MYLESINEKTKRVLEKIGDSFLAGDFYLAGGTALALHLGYRQSIDLDWFSGQDFSNEKIKRELASLGDFKLLSEEKGTIHGTLNEIRVSFFYYHYNSLFPLIKFGDINPVRSKPPLAAAAVPVAGRTSNGVNLADERDIAAMKIDAISSRGSRKDFIDIYFLLEKYSLTELIDFFEKKYKDIKYNKLHIFKSLVYFDDAESEPMPIMIKKVEWETVKEKINAEVKKMIPKI